MIRNNIIRMLAPLVEPPSAELEQNALHIFGERDGPAVEAIFHARRRESVLTFIVDPFIAALHGLSQRVMTKAMDRLEGRLIETVYKERGTPRKIRLLPDWENPEALAADPAWQCRKIFGDAVAAQGGLESRKEIERYLQLDFTHPPEILAELRRLLDPPAAE